MSQDLKSRDPKSSLLWNVVDPDDPYDIRKSMIARLPEHTQNFMGGNLEIVCLMQAAEVERLNIYLSEFKLKYRQLQRRELDRHSYEVQIKQLSEKANQAGQLRIDNQKLHEYIKKQSIQMQELSRRPNIPSSLQTQHQQLLNKYQSVLIQLQNARETIQIHFTNIAKLTEENKQLRIRYDRLDKQRLTELTQEREKYQLKIRERIELELKEVEHKYNGKINKLESDCRLHRQQIDSKNYEINALLTKNQSLKEQLENKQKQKSILSRQWEDRSKDLEAMNQNLTRKLSELEGAYQRYTRMQSQLRDTQRAFERSEEQNRYYKSEVQRLSQLANRPQDRQTIEQQQNKIALLSSEVERLTYLLSLKNQQLNESNNKYNTLRQDHEKRIKQIAEDYEIKLSKIQRTQSSLEILETEVRTLRITNQQLRTKNQSLTKEISANSSINSKRLIELQDELKKLNANIGMKNEQIYNLQAKLKSNEAIYIEVGALRKTLMEKDKLIETIESQRANYEIRIRTLTQELAKKDELGRELERQIFNNQQLRSQIQSIRVTFAQNEEYSQKLKKQIIDVKRLVQQYETDIKNGILVPHATHERANTELMMQNRQLKEEILQWQQRFNRKQREVLQSVSNVEIKFSSQIADLTNSLKILRQQNERLINDKNRVKNALSDAQKQVITKQRQYLSSLQQANRKIDELGSVNEELRRQNARLRQQISTFHDSTIRIQRDTQQRIISIYGTKLQDKDNIIASLERQVQVAREELKTLQATYQNSSGTIKNYRDRLLMASKEIQRLNELHKKRMDEIEAMKFQLENLQSIKKQLRQKDTIINNLKAHIDSIETNYKNQLRERDDIIRSLRAQIQTSETNFRNQLIQERQSIQRHLRTEFESQIQIISSKQLGLQIDNLSKANQILRNQITSLRSQLQNRGAVIKEMENQLVALRRQKQTHLQTISQLEMTVNQIRNNVQTNNQSLQKKYYEQEIEIKNLTQVIQQLEDINNHTAAQRDHLFEVSHEYKQEIAKLRQLLGELDKKQSSFVEITNKYNEITILCQQYKDKIIFYENNIEALTRKNKEYESKLLQTINEIGRLMTILKEKDASADVVAQLRQQLHNISIELANRTEQAKEWEQKYVQLYQAYKSESELSRAKILEYQNKTVTLDQQFEQLSTFVQKIKEENQQLRNRLSDSNDLIEKNKVLGAEIDRLTKINQELRADLSDTRLRLIDQMALQKRIQEHMALFVILFAEIQTLRNRVSETEKQCENVRRSSLTPHRVDRQVGRSLDIRR